MDFVISLVTVSDDDFEKYVSAIESSDLDKFIKCELKDLLNTAKMQTQQAKNMGWI